MVKKYVSKILPFALAGVMGFSGDNVKSVESIDSNSGVYVDSISQTFPGYWLKNKSELYEVKKNDDSSVINMKMVYNPDEPMYGVHFPHFYKSTKDAKIVEINENNKFLEFEDFGGITFWYSMKNITSNPAETDYWKNNIDNLTCSSLEEAVNYLTFSQKDTLTRNAIVRDIKNQYVGSLLDSLNNDKLKEILHLYSSSVKK
jgi:hypothetical protein|tara:strand:- start:2295 stop:2900 length:606 start_codon:yes stop_codon:yes gene_type:complete